MKIVTETIDPKEPRIIRSGTGKLYNVGQVVVLNLQGDGDGVAKVPAMVVGVNTYVDQPATYDMMVYFKWNDGEQYGGNYLIEGMCTWRYAVDGETPSLEIISRMIEDFSDVHCLDAVNGDTAKYCYF